MYLKIPRANFSFCCAFLSTRAKTVWGVVATPPPFGELGLMILYIRFNYSIVLFHLPIVKKMKHCHPLMDSKLQKLATFLFSDLKVNTSMLNIVLFVYIFVFVFVWLVVWFFRCATFRYLGIFFFKFQVRLTNQILSNIVCVIYSFLV